MSDGASTTMGNKYFKTLEWERFLDKTFEPLSWIYNEENKFEGSCFIIEYETDLYLVTAYHVLDGNRYIYIPFIYNEEEIDFNGFVKTWKIMLLENKNCWYDKIHDLALLRLNRIPYAGIIPISFQKLSSEVNREKNWVHYCGFTKSNVTKVRNRERSMIEKEKMTNYFFIPFIFCNQL